MISKVGMRSGPWSVLPCNVNERLPCDNIEISESSVKGILGYQENLSLSSIKCFS